MVAAEAKQETLFLVGMEEGFSVSVEEGTTMGVTDTAAILGVSVQLFLQMAISHRGGTIPTVFAYGKCLKKDGLIVFREKADAVAFACEISKLTNTQKESL